jgi:hypothetical protein
MGGNVLTRAVQEAPVPVDAGRAQRHHPQALTFKG